MAQKNLSIINKELENDIINYCKLNKIEDIEKFKVDCFKKGYNIEKYGLLGEVDEVKVVEKEVIKEVIVEKPVEIIKEVISYVEKPVEVIKEIIKEIPVDVIKEVIKEVPVEVVVTKTEYISDDSKINELVTKINNLENEKNNFILETQALSSTINELNNDKNVLTSTIQQLQLNQETIKNNDKSKLLEETLYKLRVELSEKNKKIVELENKIKELGETIRYKLATYHPGSNLKDKL